MTIEIATKERPILFSGPMMRAILAGEKTQTRRVLRPQPEYHQESGRATWTEPRQRRPYRVNWHVQTAYDYRHTWQPGRNDSPTCPICTLCCPYGQPGDRLWVRETWHLWGLPERQVLAYRADCTEPEQYTWRPSIHMPRRYSRITLEITGVRVERVQDISEADARAEGAEREFRTVVMHPSGCKDYHIPLSYRGGFANLWGRINDARGFSWESNPWVWVIEFKEIAP